MNIDNLVLKDQVDQWLQRNRERKEFQSVLSPFQAAAIYKKSQDTYLLTRTALVGGLAAALVVVFYFTWFIFHLWPFTSFHTTLMANDPNSNKLICIILLGSFIMIPGIFILILRPQLKQEFQYNRNLWKQVMSLQIEGLESWLCVQYGLTVQKENLFTIAEKTLLNKSGFVITDTHGLSHQVKMSTYDNTIEWSVVGSRR